MKRLLGVFAVMLMVAMTSGILSADDEDDKVDPEAIKKAMKTAMKEGLLKKVSKGEANDDEKEQLHKLLTEMAKVEAPKGDQDEWEERTKALVDAAKAAVDGKDGAGAALTKAANCKECHTAHKPS